MAEQSSRSRPKSFDEAFRVLDIALNAGADQFRDLTGMEYQEFRSNIEEVRKKSTRAVDQGQEILTRVVSEIDVRVRANPWAVLGGVAFGAFAFGMILGGAGKDEVDV